MCTHVHVCALFLSYKYFKYKLGEICTCKHFLYIACTHVRSQMKIFQISNGKICVTLILQYFTTSLLSVCILLRFIVITCPQAGNKPDKRQGGTPLDMNNSPTYGSFQRFYRFEEDIRITINRYQYRHNSRLNVNKIHLYMVLIIMYMNSLQTWHLKPNSLGLQFSIE